MQRPVKKPGKAKVAIVGSGNIGTDLLMKITRSSHLECTYFIGRDAESKGLQKARELGIRISDRGINAIVDEPEVCDIVFDATSARDHLVHWPILKKLGKRVIDMTPSRAGEMLVPAINLEQMANLGNVNMVSCGGQASIPLAYAIAQTQKDVEYIEVVSSISSRSAGAATRANIDEYVDTTEAGIMHFTGCPAAKTILILNPAEPPINMQATVSAKVAEPDLDRLRPAIDAIVGVIRRYVPGYEMIVPPVYEHNRIVIMVKVTGVGDYLPSYAGNLDIINCAAVAAGERLSVGSVVTGATS